MNAMFYFSYLNYSLFKFSMVFFTESYAVAGYKTAKPLAIEYWAVAKPLIITSWDDYVKPFSYWAATESVRLTKIYFQLACE